VTIAESFIENVGKGAKWAEAAALAGMVPAEVESRWRAGAHDLARGVESDEAEFVASARAARARYTATLRALAEASSGTRESSDLLALAREVEADAELADVDTGGRSSKPDLVVRDMIARADLTPSTRAKLKAAHENFTRAGLDLFAEIMDVQDRQREGVPA
jgi:hypothetical protein